ncbi:energy transducer TonB [Aliivibrio sp. S4TY2]|uniref:energy transducer TonB n=1 Tax=unclassified Aliivibrio TaxID=2645654 RepID=UPI002379AFA4|nr:MULTISPECIES: energy transducer TonB [unclassified Aliivibrio]MDD9157029.1 energy transducer TonB [Aliivibrio sp. S4TY2]MDD9160757.1 energy transducer TonB [Aliivibrio sp. S4TY1]MDD9164786.1 energy transducer TonB [Aliivibrio sp. S4MY2]MDD9168939.1 energy transducer TonB [Aliivibrio sp. S4MY4]MDD9185467.1 energy transducer TonB [Aliivibrio sp. S4MY3]
MLNFRYLAAAGISLAIHTALIWSVPEKKAFAMPTGSTSSQVNIQFVVPSVPTPQSVQTKKNEVTKPKEQTKQQATVEKKVQKQVMKKKPTVSKLIKPEKKILKEKIETKPTTETAKKTEKHVEKESTAEPVASKSGATEKPQLVQKPSFLKRPNAPRYPRIAQRKGIEGTALYEIWLNENGKQIKQELITSSGAQVLDEAALNAIRDWQFSPQVINGQAIAHRVQIPVRFSLN